MHYKILFNPFEKYSEKILISVGVLCTLIGSLLAYFFNVRFDGVLDLHFTDDVLLRQPFIDNIINIMSLTIMLFIVAKYLKRKTRSVDILSAVIIARIPYYLMPLFNINSAIDAVYGNVMKFIDIESIDQISISMISLILVFAFISVIILVWYITLLFKGFKIATHAKGIFPKVLFVIAIIVAEVLSKYLIYQLN